MDINNLTDKPFIQKDTGCFNVVFKNEDGILIIRYLDARGEYTKNYFPYRFMNEDEIIDMVLRSLY